MFQHSALALISSLPLHCGRLDTCSMLLTVYSAYLLIYKHAALEMAPTEEYSQSKTFQDFNGEHSRESLEATPFLLPPPPLWCSISLTLTFGAPGTWFTHHRFVKLQHGCALKKNSHAINHKKCQLLLLASSVRLLMRQS